MILLDWALAVWMRLALRRNETLRHAVVRMSRSRCCNTRTGTRNRAQSRRKSALDGLGTPDQRLSVHVHHVDVSAVVFAIWLFCFGTISVKAKQQIQFLYEKSEQFNFMKEFHHRNTRVQRLPEPVPLTIQCC